MATQGLRTCSVLMMVFWTREFYCIYQHETSLIQKKYFDSTNLREATQVKYLICICYQLQNMNQSYTFGISEATSLQFPHLSSALVQIIFPFLLIIKLKKCNGQSTQNKSFFFIFNRFSFEGDISRGMAYLHSRKIIHGRLTSNNCVVDDRWTVKISG